MGHFLCAKFFHVETKKIILYPLGGISQFFMDFSIYPYREILILLMGPFFQCIAYFILKQIFYDKELIRFFHYGILFFNLLPIYPLDGGKLLNVVFNFFLCFRFSFRLSILVSYMVIILFLFVHTSFSINMVLTYIVLLFLVRREELKKGVYYHKFLLERFLKNYSYSKKSFVRSERYFYRYRENKVIFYGKLCSEKEYLKKFFKNC